MRMIRESFHAQVVIHHRRIQMHMILEAKLLIILNHTAAVNFAAWRAQCILKDMMRQIVHVFAHIHHCNNLQNKSRSIHSMQSESARVLVKTHNR